ncbi:CBM35 domain-containing protein [Streptomyces sp. NPDC047928]|uniref:CBM35 domain-containing protein n=1 Tax=unclassified Streptomyces TaxID=2593676 RepID=UPI003717DA73
MAAGNNGNGAGTPEDEDPFGYLYADGQASAASSQRQGGYGYPGPAAQPGRPRTSYNQVRAVGERQYGQVPQQGQAPQQQYGQPHPQYAAPETYPGGAPTRPVPAQPQRGGRGGGPNTKGLLIGAITVVLVVVAGITVALLNKTGDEKDKAGGTNPSPGATQVEESPSPDASPSDEAPAELPKQDAATLQLTPPAVLGTEVKGAKGAGGAYVTGFNAVGAAVTWKANVDVPGEFKLYVRYAIPAVEANATLTVNGKPNSNPLGLKDFINQTDPAWEKGWQTTWAPVTLQKGENEIKISCEEGNQCNVILDWLEVKPA